MKLLLVLLLAAIVAWAQDPMCSRGRRVGDLCCSCKGKCKEPKCEAVLTCNLVSAPCFMMAEIPVTVLFTAGADRLVNRPIRQIAEGMVDLANIAFSNSRVPVKLILARFKKWDGDDKADPQALLNSFTGSDRGGSSIGILLSGLVRGCGMSHMDCQGPGIACAYGVVSVLCDPLHLAKSVGFIMGAGPDPASRLPSRFPYNQGRILERINFTNTVMANVQVGGIKIPYFSNPTVWYQGMQTGIKDRQDNAKVLTITRFSIAHLQYT
jgi:hypothetical protein